MLAGQEVGSRLLELLGGDSFFAQPLHLPDAALERGGDTFRIEIGGDAEQAWVERRVRVGVDPVDQLFLLLDAAHEPAAVSLSQDEAEQIEIGSVGVREPGAA